MSGGLWAPEEIAALRALAPLGRTVASQELGRTATSIMNKARALGIRMGKSPDGRAYGNSWRGRIPIPVSVHPLIRRLFTEMNRQRTTFYELEERSGVHWQAISAWRYRRNPRLDNLIAVANCLGLDLHLTRMREEALAA